MRYDAIVIGGGAAGLMCAREIAARGRSVAVIEHNREIGRKILISGGGRCNFTNTGTSPANFLSRNPHFAKSALARYTPADFVALVREHRIAFHEKKLGQLFCDGSARQIVEMLREDCAGRGARVIENCRVTEIRKGTEFGVETSAGSFESNALVIATGGLSIPKIGATGFGYDVARQFGLAMEPCYPALAPLVFDDSARREWSELSGVSTEVIARCGGAEFRENLLFTHRGLSGPAILQVSSYWRDGKPVDVDFAPGRDVAKALLAAKQARTRGATLPGALSELVPKRLAEKLAGEGGILRDLPDRELTSLAGRMQRWRVVPAGTEGFEKAEVTGGGVSTAELSSKTLESRKVAGLFFVGEVVDVTGHLGGYNFQWAWASGVCAGEAIAGRASASPTVD